MSYSRRFNEIWHADVCGDLFLHSLLYKKDHVLHISLDLTFWLTVVSLPDSWCHLNLSFLCTTPHWIQHSPVMGPLVFFSTKSMLCILHISSYFIDCCFEFSGIDSKEWYFKFEGCYINIFHSSSITITLHTGYSVFLLSLFLNKATSKYNDLKSAINYFSNDSALWAQCSRRESGCSYAGHQGPQLRCRECLWASLRTHGLFSHSQGFCLISETEVSLTWGLSASRGSH